MTRHQSHSGLTLVELLVVIFIIGLLVALLIPAVQAAREAGRRMQCKNHVKQLALAALTHEEQIEHFPTGGWGTRWIGDADRGVGLEQPGGWAFNILPFLEERSLYDQSSDGRPNVITARQREGAWKTIANPPSIINCPSRRPSGLYPISPNILLRNSDLPVAATGKLDYAVNSGVESASGFNSTGPTSLAHALADFRNLPIDRLGNSLLDPEANHERHKIPYYMANGISFVRSEVGIRHVTDGVSNTYLIGEKFVAANLYDVHTTNTPWTADAFPWCVLGHSTGRSALVLPQRDIPLYESSRAETAFGSAHPAGFNMAFCDGSVRVVSYDIDLEVHRLQAHRRDGMAIESR